jgi:hypothetical protein
MPPLDNEMWERFCEEYVNGYSQGQAYYRAQVVEGGKVDMHISVARTMGHRLFQKVEIKKRIKQIQESRRKKFGKGEKAIEMKLRESMNDRTFSPGNQLRATEAYMKFLGVGNEVHEHTHQGNINIINKFDGKTD